jgi:hypothetical protein
MTATAEAPLPPRKARLRSTMHTRRAIVDQTFTWQPVESIKVGDQFITLGGARRTAAREADVYPTSQLVWVFTEQSSMQSEFVTGTLTLVKRADR